IKKSKNEEIKFYAHGYIADIYKKKKDYKRAKTEFRKIIADADKKQWVDKMTGDIIRSRTYELLGDIAENELKEHKNAVAYYNKAIIYAVYDQRKTYLSEKIKNIESNYKKE
ncbi:MAG: hypothetical protein AB1546_11725, partial [bacterium]